MDAKAEELSAIVQEIRQRVRARGTGAAPGPVPLADLNPLLRARDAAEAKVASIGSVNPRPPGLINAIVQRLKRSVARALDWHVREQVEFNRGAMNCVQSTIEALTETNRAIASLAASVAELRTEVRTEARHSQDIRAHWIEWRQEWERKLARTEIQFLRSLSDLQAAWQHRVTLLDESHREYIKAMHSEFESALNRSMLDVQKRLWADLDRIRTEYETIIHSELRVLRQKPRVAEPAPTPSEPLAQLDWLKFSEKFRGDEAYVKRHLHLYTERFAGAGAVLDIGCGRGEALEAFRDAGIHVTGIDTNPECIALCQAKGLAAEKADLFEFLNAQPDGSVGGVLCLQVVEHLPPASLPVLVALVHAKLNTGALFAIETPNPECLAIFARHFYLDPTHAKPIPPALMAFYLEEAGFGRLETLRLEPAVDSMPSLGSLPEDFRRDFFGPLDYAIFGRKLG